METWRKDPSLLYLKRNSSFGRHRRGPDQPAAGTAVSGTGELSRGSMFLRSLYMKISMQMICDRNAYPDIDGMIEAIKNSRSAGDCRQTGQCAEAVTGKEYPVIQEIKDKMQIWCHRFSDEWQRSTVFGLFTNPKAAQQAYEELRYGGESSGLAKQVYLTNFYNQKRKTIAENKLKVNMNEYLPLRRDVVFNALRQADFKGRAGAG